MTREEVRLIEEAMRLPPPARAALAGRLLESLDGPVDPDAEAAWAKEIERRIREFDEGRMKTVPWAEVRKAIEG